MSAILSSYWVIFVWCAVTVLFFCGVYHLAKSKTPGADMITFLASSSSIEGAILFGVIALLVGQADKWRDELDAQDVANKKDLKDLTDAELAARIKAAMPEIKPAGSPSALEPLGYPVMDEGAPMALIREQLRRELIAGRKTESDEGCL